MDDYDERTMRPHATPSAAPGRHPIAAGQLGAVIRHAHVLISIGEDAHRADGVSEDAIVRRDSVRFFSGESIGTV
jgi:hypothetical protein